MKNLLIAFAAFVSLSASARDAVEIRARDYTCHEMGQLIQQYGKVFVRMGFGGRSFRYPPYRCDLGDKREVVYIRDAAGVLCEMDFACVYDPQSPYNRD